MNLFNIGFDAGAELVRAVERSPERCPVCGKMAEYVDVFPNGRIFAAHASRAGTFKSRVTGLDVPVVCAVVCHGVVKK